MRARFASSFGEFRCARCHALVASAHLLSGVNNRNHCPYCLWSFHLDLYEAGDRLSACKSSMKPIGLTLKPGRNKYRPGSAGELMLVHECTACLALSINRIAADDDSETIMTLFHASLNLDRHMQTRCLNSGIKLLKEEDFRVLHTRLHGNVMDACALPRA